VQRVRLADEGDSAREAVPTRGSIEVSTIVASHVDSRVR
jgi:hypothetical protein